MLTDGFARVDLAHCPTPLEPMPNLSKALGGPDLWIKRDDCTGLAFGGNKARQLEYYIGDAATKGADILLTTGATQSNHVRSTVAAARKLGIDCEVQLEKRVSGRRPEYHTMGNPMLVELMQAPIHHYAVGEDEEGADRALFARAEELKAAGRSPYVIPLAPMDHPPLGALGYVRAAEELQQDCQRLDLAIDAYVLPSGSGSTHAGLLVGLRALGIKVPVYGFCVRRDQVAQADRVYRRTCMVADMIGHSGCVTMDDVLVDDGPLGPGYGQLTDDVHKAIALTARHEGILLDPTYTAKSMAGLITQIAYGHYDRANNVVYLHTGGTPALFGYPELVDDRPVGAQNPT